MGFQCSYCDSILNTKGNRSRHEHKFHPDEIGLPVYQCSLCEFFCRKISLLEDQMKTAHQRFTNCCQSCLLGFNDCHLYVQHMTSVHHLPVLGEQASTHSIGKCIQWSAEIVRVNRDRRIQ